MYSLKLSFKEPNFSAAGHGGGGGSPPTPIAGAATAVLCTHYQIKYMQAWIAAYKQ